MDDPWNVGFARFLDAACPYLAHLVMAGGWASRLHRLSDHAQPTDFEPLGTKDVDAVVPRNIEAIDEPLDVRLKRRGFEERLATDFEPPVTHYALAEPDGFEVEFLTDQPGGYSRRDGSVDATQAIAGVTAQKLHYIGLLFVEPWTVRVRRADGFPMDVDAREVRVANPISYILQKLLARPHREQEKREKDVLYIHDTLELFGDAEDQLELAWGALRPRVPPRWLSRAQDAAARLAHAADPDVVGATRIARAAGRAIDPERIGAVLRVGLSFLGARVRAPQRK